MRVLVIDNYDSFVYNLVQYVGAVVTDGEWLGGGADRPAEAGREPASGEVFVRRNDEVTLADVDELDPDAIVVSPGPGTPAEAGISMPLFAERDYPTLGVCLGHQALCAARGATVGHAEAVVHGKPSVVSHDGSGIFAGIPSPIEVGRYHSLAVARGTLPDALAETAWTGAPEGAEGARVGEDASDVADDERVVMAVRATDRPHVGVQFHPESILTDDGRRLVATFVQSATDPVEVVG